MKTTPEAIHITDPLDPRSTDQVYGTFVVAAMRLGVLGPASVRLENKTVKMRKRLTKLRYLVCALKYYTV